MKKEMSIQEMFENITAIRGALMNLKTVGLKFSLKKKLCHSVKMNYVLIYIILGMKPNNVR